MSIRRLSPCFVTLLLVACGQSQNTAPVDANDPPVTQPPPADGPHDGPADPPPTAEAPPPPVVPRVLTPFSGDFHVHSDHSSDGSILRQGLDQRGPGNMSVSTVVGLGETAGLDFMPITDHRTYNQHWDPLWTSDSVLLIPGEEANGRPHSTVHGAIDMIPQGATPPDDPGHRRLQQAVWEATAQGAVWVMAHPSADQTNDDGTLNQWASAFGYHLAEIWNKADDLELEIAFSEDRWNAGYRHGVVGASDIHFLEQVAIGAGPGSPSTRVFAEELTERGLLDAMRRGRTAISSNPNGPVVYVEADADGDGNYEAGPGDELIVDAGATVQLRVFAEGALGSTVDVYSNPGRQDGAEPLISFVAGPGTEQRTFEFTLDQPHRWFRAEARGVGQFATLTTIGQPIQLLATASPVFVSAEAPASPQPEVPTPADAGSDDGAAVAFGELYQFSGFPDVAVVGDTAHVVGEVHSRTGTHVVYRRAVGQALSESVDLAPESASARFPRIAVDGDDVWVVWEDERAGQIPRQPAIWLRHSADGGLNWSAAQQVSAGDGRALHPDIAVVDGRPVVAWADNSQTDAFDVLVQVIGVDEQPVNVSAPGKMLSAGNPTDSRSPRHPASVRPAVAVAPDGSVTAVWQDNRLDPNPGWTGDTTVGLPPGDVDMDTLLALIDFTRITDGSIEETETDDWEILAARRAPAAGDWSMPINLSTDDTRADRNPDVLHAADGTLVAVWDSKEMSPAGVNTDIRAVYSLDGGQTVSMVDVLAPAPEFMGLRPRLGRSGQRVRAVWYDTRFVDWRQDLLGAVFDPDAQAWTDAPVGNAPGVNTFPAVADGVVVFASARNARRVQRDPTQQVMLRRLD